MERAIALSTAQSGEGVAPILTLKHLAIQAGVPLDFLEDLADRRIDPYHIHAIRKRDGISTRWIAAPKKNLRVLQRWLLDNVYGRVSVDGAAFAYVKGRSAVQCAASHVDSSWLIKLDVSDFFHQFDEAQVFELTCDLQYSRLVSLEIARLVTRHTTAKLEWLPAKYHGESRRRLGGLEDSTMDADFGDKSNALAHPQGLRLGYLPQGAATSGAITNLLCRPLDAELSALANQNYATYTRYADDIVISGTSKFNRAKAVKLMHAVVRIMDGHHLPANPAKSLIVPPGRPLEVLGIRVDGPKLSISRRVRTKIEFHLRGIEKFGAAAHARHVGFDDPMGLGNYLHGLIRYAHDIDESRATDYFRRLAASHPAFIPPSPLEG